MSSFSLRRVGQMLQADWQQQKRQFLLAIPFTVVLILIKPYWNVQTGLMLMLTFLFYIRLKLHTYKKAFLMQPGSVFEKFAAIMIVGFVLSFLAALLNSYFSDGELVFAATWIATWILAAITTNSKPLKAGIITVLAVIVISFISSVGFGMMGNENGVKAIFVSFGSWSKVIWLSLISIAALTICFFNIKNKQLR